MKVSKVGVVAVAAMNLAACATMVRGTEQQVSVNTDPVGAKIRFSNGQDCIGPCTIKAKRNQSLQITIRKDGCATQTATMIPTLGGAGVILGGLVDYGTGAVYDLQPNPLTVTLVCGNGFGPTATVPQVVPAALTQASASAAEPPAPAATVTPIVAPASAGASPVASIASAAAPAPAQAPPKNKCGSGIRVVGGDPDALKCF